MSDYSRITGLASGMDTENMIKDLMKAESQKKIKVEQEKQLVEWEREAYRDISKMLTEYKNNNFDILSPQTNFRSATMFSQFTSSVTSGGVESNAVTVTGNADISKLNHTINKISQLATKDLYESRSKLKESIVGNTTIDAASVATINDSIDPEGNDTFVINFDGVSKTITLDGGYRTDTDANAKDDLLLDLETKINNAFGAGKINVSYGIDVENLDQLIIKADEGGHQTSLIASDANILGNLGFKSGDTDYIKSSTSLSNAFGIAAGTAIDIEINGISDFGITSDDTIKTMIDKINGSNAGVTMSYSELSGKMNIQSNETGEVNKISFTDSFNDFLATHLKIDLNDDPNITTEGYTAAQDAEFTIDGVATSRSNNDFTIDGANYSLKQLHTDTTNPIEVSLSPDTDGLVEKITGFVDKYNEIIETINGKLNEKKDYDYKPLTEDEKEAMTEDEIKLWEERTKSGLLSSSSELQNIASRMRTLIYEPIEGLDISLRDIGIESSSDYKENGKLLINQDKLKENINNNYSKVVDLFTKTSDIDYKDGANRAQRTSESGIAHRIYDVLQDNIRTTRNDSGKKGTLLEKAGIAGDITEFKNTMNTKVKQYDDRIDDLIEYLSDRENYYYRMFAQMEKAMTEMQTQASWMQGNMG